MGIIGGDSSKDVAVLLLHPGDSVLNGQWSSLRWNLVVDLGWGGSSQYEDWSEKIGCPVRGLLSFANWREDVPQMRQFCGIGIDRLVDAEGIDWWELLAPNSYQRLYEFLLVQKLAAKIQTATEIRVTRPHHLADALGGLLGVRVDPFVAKIERLGLSRFTRFTEKLQNLTLAQIIQIAGDKWDSDYRVRRHFAHCRQSRSAGKTTLLPSAYRNVSRVLTSYAGLLPNRNFLLVTTRADGEIKDLPANVIAVPLAAYSSQRDKNTEREIELLTPQWELTKQKLYAAHPNLPRSKGLLEGVDRTLQNGLRIRDAWRGVFDQEEIGTILCADENNPYTRLPVLLAQRRGIHSVYCSHGALDATIPLRGVCSDTYLAKGEMEKDYLTKECGIPQERISVGAPPGSHVAAQDEGAGTHIAFFSEPYELYYGRTETLYREVLPGLCAIAREYGRKVMVKLHPFESLAGRSQFVKRVLRDMDRSLVEITAVPLSTDLMRKIWFSLTVESSVAVECALAAIPCFLCGWFDIDLYSYGKQYEKFGVARILRDPRDLSRIPELLKSQRPGAEVRSRLYHPITRGDLESVLQCKATAPSKHELSTL